MEVLIGATSEADGEQARLSSASPPKEKTPTNLFELPLEASAGQAACLGAHLEVGRQFYNAVLSRSGSGACAAYKPTPPGRAARAISRTRKQERKAAFSALRERYGFSECAVSALMRKPHRGRGLRAKGREVLG